MNEFDKKMRMLAKQESEELPESVKKKVEDTLSALPEPKKQPKIRAFPRVVAAAACFTLLFLFVLPNVSVAYATAAEKIPVLGKIVQVLTIRNYFMQTKEHDLDVKVPQIQNSEQSHAADSINKDTDALTSILVKQFYAELAENGSNGFGSLYVDYEKFTDTPSWFTLRIEVTEEAGSSDRYFKYYHIDKRTDKVITLEALFKDKSYKPVLRDEINRQIKAQMAQDSSKTYFTAGETAGEDFASLEPTHNFYWNKNGDLVIPFDKYEIAPGSMGTPEFTIPKSVIKDILKPEYQNLQF